MDDLEKAVRDAVQMSADAWAKYNQSKAALIKLTNLGWMERIDAELAALNVLNAELEAANAHLRKVRSRPEHAFHMSRLRIVEKAGDDNELDETARDRLIKILTPAMSRQKIDPETALRDGIMLDRIHQKN